MLKKARLLKASRLLMQVPGLLPLLALGVVPLPAAAQSVSSPIASLRAASAPAGPTTAATAATAASLPATPGDGPDPLVRLLADQGLLPTPAKDRPADVPRASAAVPPTTPVTTPTPPAGAGSPQAAPAEPRTLRRRVSDAASDMVLSAMNFLGVPYKRGGQSAGGFDCSGFTRYMFEHSLGLVLPRRAEEQAHSPALTPVARDQLRPGDLVFFNTLRRTFSHVGIYIGDNKFIHAPRSGKDVRIEDMRMAYWTQRFNGARRPPQLIPKEALDKATAAAAAAMPLANTEPLPNPALLLSSGQEAELGR